MKSDAGLLTVYGLNWNRRYPRFKFGRNKMMSNTATSKPPHDPPLAVALAVC
jgi:hypothetical protein